MDRLISLLRAMIIAIDPGKSGAWATFDPYGELCSTYKIKTPPKTRFLHCSALCDLALEANGADHAVIEGFLDQGLSKQSTIATNTTAANHGMLQAAVLLGMDSPELTIVRPADWKRRMGLLKQDKSASVRLAIDLVGEEWLMKPRMRVPNVDIAEAVLIGIDYGRENLGWDR